MNTIKLNTRNMKMDRINKLVVALVMVAGVSLVLASKAQASFSEKDAGTRGGQFLKLPVGARAVGMGSAHTAIADDANAIYYNVAGLARLDKKNAEYMYSAIMQKDKVDGESNPGLHWVTFAMPISEQIGSAGVALQYFSAGDINETDISARKVGTFSPSDLAFNLAYARHILAPEHSVGLNLKIVNSKIKESATTVAIDLGAQCTKMMEGKMNLGFAVQNLGGSLKYETDTTKLPILIKLGAGYKAMENWVSALDIIFPEDNSPKFAIGTDYKWKLQEDMSIAGRLGYNTFTNKVDGFSGLSFGIGFGFKVATFDLAWLPMGDLGQTIRFSVGAKF